MRLTLVVAAIGFALSVAPAFAQTAQVTGRVVDADSKPVAGVRVTMSFPGRPPFPPSQATTSDDRGQFVFDDVPVRRAMFRAQKTGFAFDALIAPEFDVSADRPNVVEIVVHRGAVIAGRILNHRGEPLPDMMVSLVRRWVRPTSGVSMVEGAGGPTNDLGEFRVAGLNAGDYVLRVTPDGSPRSSVAPPSATTAWAPTYFPGVTDETAARLLTVQHGQTLDGIEFRVAVAPAYRVEGLVVDQAGQPVEAMVLLISQRGSQNVPPVSMNASTKPDGLFAFARVVSGTYELLAQPVVRRNGSVSIGPSSSGPPPRYKVEVGNTDLIGIKIVAATPRQ